MLKRKHVPVYMTIVIISLIALLINTPPIVNKKKLDVNRGGQSVNITRDVISHLSSPEMEGRLTGSHGERLAAEYIVDKFKKNKLQPLFGSSYLQEFYLPPFRLRMKEGREGMELTGASFDIKGNNIAALLPAKSDKYLILSAHYDHLGIENGAMYPGANDNASGIATLLETANKFHAKSPPINVIFVAFSGEEEGLFGSNYFCDHLPVSKDKIIADINLDTVGCQSHDYYLWYHEDNYLLNKLGMLAVNKGFTILKETPQNHNSDHFAFYKSGIPALTVVSKDWLTYNHTPQDTPEKISEENIKKWSAILEEFIRSISSTNIHSE